MSYSPDFQPTLEKLTNACEMHIQNQSDASEAHVIACVEEADKKIERYQRLTSVMRNPPPTPEYLPELTRLVKSYKDTANLMGGVEEMDSNAIMAARVTLDARLDAYLDHKAAKQAKK